MNALVLCAGQGTRLKSVIGDQPKATIKFGEHNLLQRILAELLSIKAISQIYINVSRSATELLKDLQLINYFPKIRILYETIPWGPSLTVYEAIKFSCQGLLVIHGDLLLESGTLSKFVFGLQMQEIDKSFVAVHERPISNATQMIVTDKSGYVDEIIWRKDSAFLFDQYRENGLEYTFVDSGIYFFSPSSKDFLITPKFGSGISEGLLPNLLFEKMLKITPWVGLRYAIDTSDKLDLARNVFNQYPEKFRI